jgi:hypothetical protein
MRVVDKVTGELLLEKRGGFANLTLSINDRELPRRTDFSNANFAGMNLKGFTARQFTFRNADFEGADLTQADLSRCDLRGANFRGANLLYCRMREAIFDDTIILNWRSHDLLFYLLQFVARNEQKERPMVMGEYVKRMGWSAIPHTFREWCWPEYDKYLPHNAIEWMVNALRPWVAAERTWEEVPPELRERIRTNQFSPQSPHTPAFPSLESAHDPIPDEMQPPVRRRRRRSTNVESN